MAKRIVHTLVLSILTLLAITACSSGPDTEAIARAVAAESEGLKAEIRTDVQNQIAAQDDRVVKDFQTMSDELDNKLVSRIAASAVNTELTVNADVDQALAGIYKDLDAREAKMYGEVQNRIDGIDNRITRRFETSNELLAQKYQEALDRSTDVFIEADSETRQMVDESTELMKTLMLETFDAQRVRVSQLITDESDAQVDRVNKVLQELADDQYATLYEN